MEFPFESLEVYQKALNLYRLASAPEQEGCSTPATDLKHGILELTQGIVVGAHCWNRDVKVRHFLNALDMARCLTALTEAAVIEGCVNPSLRERFREEIDGLCKMLASLARKTRDWPEKGDATSPTHNASPSEPPMVRKSGTATGESPRRRQRGVALDTAE